jgi:hypothetical protein
MANATIKITQLPPGNTISASTILPIVGVNGTPTTQQVAVGNIANFTLLNAGNTLPPAYLANLSYNVVNAAQPNITSVGNLTRLTITNLSNFNLPGGVNGQVLKTDGNGNLSWGNSSAGGLPGGLANYIQYNSGSNTFSGSSSFTFDSTNNKVNTTNLEVTTNFITVNSNITGSLNANSVSITGTSNTKNIIANGNITANFFIGDGSQLTNVTANSSANANFATNANFAAYAGNITVNSQANITSLGNLTGLQSNGAVFINNNTNSTSNATGALRVTGGIGVTGNIHSGNEIHSRGNVLVGGQSLFVGPSADATGLLNPTLVIFHGGDQYIQAALKNSLANGSADWVAYGDNGTESQGWTDMGFTSSNFNDANYTITGPGDGYLFVETFAGSYGGNLVLATGDLGTTKDIIFATSGFLAVNEFGRISDSNNSLELTRANASITFPDGSIQNTAFTGDSGNSSSIANGNSNVSIATANGNVTIAAVGNTTMTITGTGANITGILNATGNITGTNLVGTLANGTSNISITSNSNVVTTINSSAILTTYSGGIKIGGSGFILSPGGAGAITLNNNGANIPTTNVTTWLNVTGSNGATITGATATGVGALNAGVTATQLPNTIASFTSNINYYTQVTLQNKSTGTDATTDYILTADNGSDTVNYGDFGIINSGYDNNTPNNSLGNIVFAADTYLYAQGNTSNSSQSGGNLAIGTTVPGKNVKIFAGGVNNSSIIANISNTGIAVNGNVTATNFSGNISITGNVIGTSPNVTLVAGSYSTVFDNTGVATFPGDISTTGNFVGNGAALTNVAVRTTGSWTVATGTNTYSITVPANGNYQLWVRGNIPNGIIAYQATVSVTNTNVPVLGTQRAWNYTGGGSPILLTTMPTQIVGAEGTISTATVSSTTNNVFDFVISNTSGSPQTVSWGYVTL